MEMKNHNVHYKNVSMVFFLYLQSTSFIIVEVGLNSFCSSMQQPQVSISLYNGYNLITQALLTV